MEKITEKLLLEKGSPKSKKLEDIKTLNLSKLGLKCTDLPVKLLSRLWSLESWDLSGNRLQEMPKNLELPKLRRLDLSDNQMEDVTPLECLCSLEELKMEDNLYITVSDNYKLMTLLPNLRSYNGKDITTTANHVRFVFTENLKTRMVAVWEKSFTLPDPFTEQKLSVLEKDFVNAACREVKYGPSSVSDFTKWKVATMAREYLHSLIAPKKETPKKTCEVSTPVKRKHQTPALTDSQVSLTPSKKPRSDPSASPAEDSPRKSCLRLKNQALTGGVPLSPARRSSRPPTPTRASAEKAAARKPCNVRTMKIVAADGARGQRGENTSDDAIKKSRGRTQPVHLQPLHVLQCHSKQDNSEDFSTQLWACAFQPQHASSGSRLVATCGGDSVCVIDCEAGMVMKKYKVPGEEFFTLAWSTVLMSRGGGASAQTCSILAAGGKRGLVKLIHPKYNVAYGEFRASRKALSVLRFNHRRGNFLFTGSYDNKIILWDIGGVDSSYNFKVVCWRWRAAPPRYTSACPPPGPTPTCWRRARTACTATTHNYPPAAPPRGPERWRSPSPCTRRRTRTTTTTPWTASAFSRTTSWPPRTSRTAASTCGAGTGRARSGPARADACEPPSWPSCAGSTRIFPTWRSTPVLAERTSYAETTRAGCGRTTSPTSKKTASRRGRPSSPQRCSSGPPLFARVLAKWRAPPSTAWPWTPTSSTWWPSATRTWWWCGKGLHHPEVGTLEEPFIFV
nr:leucine-rich repeat and WD repeat-containing protein 1-like isoform X2 [Nerophis lumbriciformis]